MPSPNIDKQTVITARCLVPIGVFFALIVYGLFIHPVVFGGTMLPLEVLILIAICFSAYYLISLGFSWDDLQKQIVKKIGESIPVVLILLAIGVLIGSWIVSGTIPMLIYYGISIINPSWLYVFSFFICITFSLLTGTSWGSAGTIGIVMMGITQVYGMDINITAAAVVGGSFFGDKLSPLSDTTNIASLASGVPLYAHIKSMMYTTGPAALVAASGYVYLSLTSATSSDASYAAEIQQTQQTLDDLSNIFNFHWLLLLPMLVVIYGTITKKSIFLTLLNSAWTSMLLALLIQDFSLSDVFESAKSGFHTDMSPAAISSESLVLNILNRGGVYNLIEGVMTCILIFTFMGILEVINAVEVSISSFMKSLNKSWQLVTATLTATLITNLTTSNQYATSFIIGTAFKEKYDELGIDKNILSRSIEDAGTMMENLVPWTPSGIFMASTLGVATWDYAPFQFLSLANIMIAYLFACTGIFIFKRKKEPNE